MPSYQLSAVSLSTKDDISQKKEEIKEKQLKTIALNLILAKRPRSATPSNFKEHTHQVRNTTAAHACWWTQE